VVENEKRLLVNSLIQPVIAFIAKVNAPPVEISFLNSFIFWYLLPVAASFHRLNDLMGVISFLHGVKMHIFGGELNS